MKKIITLLTSAALCASLAACGSSSSESASSSESTGVSGTFTGKAAGIAGEDTPVVVTLTLEDSVITNVEVSGEGETQDIGTVAMETLPEEIVEGNSLSVDTVSGATVTSEAIIEAAEAALESAGLNPSDYMN